MTHFSCASSQPARCSELSLDELSQVSGGVALVTGRVVQGVALVTGRVVQGIQLTTGRVLPGAQLVGAGQLPLGGGVLVNPQPF
jgi:hypothetical protein